MTNPDPLPFRLKVPDRDTLGLTGARSISYRLEGLLHLDGDTITLEWSATRRTQALTLTGVKDEVDHSPVGTADIPVSWISRTRVMGGWWYPRLQLWARRLEAFEGIPTVRGARLTLLIDRRDRQLAVAFAAAVEAERRRALAAGSHRMQLKDDDTN